MSGEYECPGCGHTYPRTFEFFDKTYDNCGDGLRLRCKQCRRERVIRKERSRGRKPRKETLVIDGMRRCIRCDEMKEDTDGNFGYHWRRGGKRNSCRRCELDDAMPYRNSPKGRALQLYHHYLRHDILRGRDNDLTPEIIFDLLDGAWCFYCDTTVNLGLDRCDNSRGHTEDNVVPCCELCNATRSNRFSVYDMTAYIGPAIKRRRMK